MAEGARTALCLSIRPSTQAEPPKGEACGQAPQALETVISEPTITCHLHRETSDVSRCRRIAEMLPLGKRGRCERSSFAWQAATKFRP